MSLLEVFGIAVALSIDAMVVALCWSATQGRIAWSCVAKFALVFGFFQGAMPAAGWVAGDLVIDFVHAWDHWVAALLLFGVAASMVREAFEDEDDETEPCCGKCGGRNKTQGIAWGTLTVLAVATSLDALAVGFSFAMANVAIAGPAVIIALVCALLTAFSVVAGKKLGEKATRHAKKMSIAGALVLIAIALRILWEHGVFG